MSKIDATELELNGVKYVRADSVKQQQAIPGKRAVVVCDRGWIFAGDVTESEGRIRLTRAVWVFRWESIGFDGVISDPKSKKATIKPMADLDLPKDAELFRVPVPDDWGM